jgi:hypothetical protein
MITKSDQICPCKRFEYEVVCQNLIDVGLYSEGSEVQQLIVDEFKRQHPCQCVEVPRLRAKIRLVRAGLFVTTTVVPDNIADSTSLTVDILDAEGNKRVYTDEEIAAVRAEAEELDATALPEE